MGVFSKNVALLGAVACWIGADATNSYAEVSASGHITWMSGRFNVPGKPQASSQATGQPMYLWPGLDTYGQDCGLWQPVLGYSDRGGNWWISNWFSNCPGVPGGYCHDAAQTVYPGDEVYFWIRLISTLTYEMGWSSGTKSSKMQKPCKNRLPKTAWTIECETYFTPSCSTKRYMPTTPWNMWDITVRDQDNQEIHQNERCVHTQDRPLNCHWSGGGHSGIEQTYNGPCGGTKNSTEYESLPPIADCKGNKACEDVNGYIPGRAARALLLGLDKLTELEGFGDRVEAESSIVV